MGRKASIYRGFLIGVYIQSEVFLSKRKICKPLEKRFQRIRTFFHLRENTSVWNETNFASDNVRRGLSKK